MTQNTGKMPVPHPRGMGVPPMGQTRAEMPVPHPVAWASRP